MTAGISISRILRPVSVVVTLVYLTLAFSAQAANSNFDDRILAIDSGKSPPFTLLAIETLVPVKTRQFDSPSLRVMGVYGLDTVYGLDHPQSYQENATKGSVPLVAETPQGLLQTVKTLGAGYDHEGSLNSTTLVVAQDAGNITPVEQSILDEKDVPPLDPSQIPSDADGSKTQLWHDLNNLANASAAPPRTDQPTTPKPNCKPKPATCTGDNCPQDNQDNTQDNQDNTNDAPCIVDDGQGPADGSQTNADGSQMDADGSQTNDCLDCYCSDGQVQGGSLGSGYFGYGAGGGGGGGGFGGGGGGSGSGSGAGSSSSSSSSSSTPTPEPSTYLIMAGAALVVAAVRRRQMQKNR